MAYITLPEGVPGIIGPMMFRPETAKPMNELVEVLLRGPHSLSSGERELIAAFTSYRNKTLFCYRSHGASAAHHLNGNIGLVYQVLEDYHRADISDKLKSLLAIAEKVQMDGKLVAQQDIDNAKQHGATELEIHDTVLIAAAFCMYNRYVDGLGTFQPAEIEAYRETGRMLAEDGYISAIPEPQTV
ncbi:MAG TPA: carboxymuconolactone decarboxylase family protein [Chitinophagales bacterium]|nr:carboxymuconolactone decarboxylase family protein [Chitinophagales bacterium]HMU70694.1 carboxymuconolactone decarboxylase family protein [Chitinophagales bacterium]HMX03435.1 carboxymuconolactone decarboxylase family protein [Chitinophagales bacterium]HMZ90453.1 carboxymuconolactone decarboxylase family protein [Chitinophagales bacterium]HNA59084.1 carboxymuconolactone decarboxylase family protein [Chitinophagales bacterium]